MKRARYSIDQNGKKTFVGEVEVEFAYHRGEVKTEAEWKAEWAEYAKREGVSVDVVFRKALSSGELTPM